MVDTDIVVSRIDKVYNYSISCWENLHLYYLTTTKHIDTHIHARARTCTHMRARTRIHS